MTKMFKRVLSTVLALMMAFSVTACGSSTSTVTQEEANANAEAVNDLVESWSYLYYMSIAFYGDPQVASDVVPNEGWYISDMTEQLDVSLYDDLDDDSLVAMVTSADGFTFILNYMASTYIDYANNMDPTAEDYDSEEYDYYASYNFGGYVAAYFNGDSVLPVCVYWSDNEKLLTLAAKNSLGTDAAGTSFIVGEFFNTEEDLEDYSAEYLF